jgi:Bacterial PH domain
MSPHAQAETLTYSCPHCRTPVEVSPLAACEPLRCPNPACGKPFRVELPAAKPLAAPVATPAPADGQGQSAPAAVPVAAASAGVAEPVRTVDKDDLVAHVRLSMWRRYPGRCLAYALLIAGGLVGGMALINDWWWLGAPAAALGALAAARFAIWWLRMAKTSLTITTMRVILETGVMRREATEMRRDQVADLQVRQNLPMRWLDVGDLVLTSSVGDRNQVVVMAVPHPEEVAELVRAPKTVSTQPVGAGAAADAV